MCNWTTQKELLEADKNRLEEIERIKQFILDKLHTENYRDHTLGSYLDACY